MTKHETSGTPAPQAEEVLRPAIQEAIDLLTERTHGSAARSPSHNARLTLQAALAATPAPQPLHDVPCLINPEPEAPLIQNTQTMIAEDDWDSIFCAPRNGTEILVWNGRRRHVAFFDRVEDAWVSSFKTTTKRLIVTPPPTHWQHLPTPPSHVNFAVRSDEP